MVDIRARTLLIALLLAAAGPARAQAPPAAGFSESLALLGLEADRLTVGIERDWLGSMPDDGLPYLLPHLAQVHRQPRRLLELATNLAGAGDLAVHGRLGDGPLLGPITVFALQPRLAASRGFRTGIAIAPPRPGLLTAMLEVAGSAPRWPAGPVDLGAFAADLEHLPEPGPRELELPAAMRGPLGVLLEACWRASAWIELSWRGVPPESVAVALMDAELTRHLAAGARWWPALDQAAERGDDEARAYALTLVAAALEATLPKLEAAAGTGTDTPWVVTTALGRVVVAGAGSDRIECRDDCLLVIDLGGDDVHLGTGAAARWPRQAVSVLVDLAGDDRYEHAGADLAQGAGLGGVGILVDVRGHDAYQAGDRCQGSGLLGYGVLWDITGDDHYAARSAAQGSAVFGGGLLLEGGGDDGFVVHGEGQGFAGPAAVGALVDLAGADRYRSEPDPGVAGRADPHSDLRVATSNAQGAGVGRRGDLGNGHAWAGGIGLLVDAGGDDVYTCGNFCQGLGYWYGTGLLVDGSGDDTYRSTYFSQGSALHRGAGLLLDREGDDVHWLRATSGASLGYAWDQALGLFVDSGGDDLYRLHGTGLGGAERRSLGLFIDTTGCDTYVVLRPARCLGYVDRHPDDPAAADSLSAMVTASRAPQAGLFFDLGGDDTWRRPSGSELLRTASPGRWFLPGAELDWSPLHVGAGLDLAGPGLGLDELLRSWD